MSHEDAELAVLEMALADELAQLAPPDVWSRLQQRGRPTARWLAAALLLLGAGVVAAVMLLARSEPKAATAPDQHRIEVDRDGPRSVAEAVARLDAIAKATVEAQAVRSAATGRWYALDESPLEDLLRSKPLPDDLDDVTRAQLLDCLRAATPQPRVDGTVWTHSIRLGARTDAGDLDVLVGTVANGAPQLAFAGVQAALPFAVPAFPSPQLAPVFDEATQLKIERRGFVLGDAQLANMPTDARRLRLREASAQSLATLPQFAGLQALDLVHSPRCHEAAALRLLAGLPLRSLVLCASWLDAEGCAAIASMPTLQELFLVGPEGFWDLIGTWTAPPAPGIDDDAVAAIARLGELTELTICGGVFDDRGLAQLAGLRQLRRLGLVACPHITEEGWRAFAGHELRELYLPGCVPPTATASSLAGLPKLRELLLGAPDVDTSLAALATLPALEKLTVIGRMPAAGLACVAQLPHLRELGLQLQPPLVDADLPQLYGAVQLEKLRLPSDRLTAAGLSALRQALPRCTVTDELW